MRGTFARRPGLDVTFVQDNHSRSVRNVLRGIHYQMIRPQAKLVRVVSGSGVRCRGRSAAVIAELRPLGRRRTELRENKRQLWIPPGFGHGFLVRSEFADFLYKTTEYWIAEYDRAVAWNDAIAGDRLATGRASPVGIGEGCCRAWIGDGRGLPLGSR